MSSIIVRLGAILPDSVKEYVYEIMTPRVAERQSGMRAQVEHALRVLSASLETEVRAQEARIPRLLDSEDVRWALREMRDRVEHLIRALSPGFANVEGLIRFIETAMAMGVGGIKAGANPDEVADAVSRAMDHLSGYMLGNGFIEATTTSAPPHHFVYAEVRKVNREVPLSDLLGWRGVAPDRAQRVRRVHIEPPQTSRIA